MPQSFPCRDAPCLWDALAAWHSQLRHHRTLVAGARWAGVGQDRTGRVAVICSTQNPDSHFGVLQCWSWCHRPSSSTALARGIAPQMTMCWKGTERQHGSPLTILFLHFGGVVAAIIVLQAERHRQGRCHVISTLSMRGPRLCMCTFMQHGEMSCTRKGWPRHAPQERTSVQPLMKGWSRPSLSQE
jgi:hypothetical protein